MPPLSAGSTAASALDLLGLSWEYVFASESRASTRRALLAAWAARGLTPASAFSDATSAAAVSAPTVDVWVCTPPCEAHSGLNRHRSASSSAHALLVIEAALAYLHRRPPFVIIENVVEPELVESITALLLHYSHYTWFGGVLDPRTTCDDPVARPRFFWVGIL